MQFEDALRSCIFSRATRDGQKRIALIQKGSFDGDLPAGERHSPETFPALCDRDANAESLIAAELYLIGSIENGVGESQEIAAGVIFLPNMDDGVAERALDNLQPLSCEHDRTCEKEECSGDDRDGPCHELFR